MNPWLTEKDAAKYVNRSIKTLRRWEYSGELSRKRSGGIAFYLRTELDQAKQRRPYTRDGDK